MRVWLRPAPPAIGEDASERAAQRKSSSRTWFQQIAAAYGATLTHGDHTAPVAHGRHPLFVSVSRSDRLFAVAISRRPVGLDVEPVPGGELDPLLVRRTCTPREWRSWSALEPAARRSTFLRWWVRKEALVKAVDGMATMSDFDVRRSLVIAGRRLWSMRDLPLPDALGHACAVATPVGARVTVTWDGDAAVAAGARQSR